MMVQKFRWTMLGFFRRFQKSFFIVVTCLVVLSFLFFGTSGSFFQGRGDSSARVTVGKLIDGSKLTKGRLDGLVRILERGVEEGTDVPNLLNGSFVHREFMLQGLGKLLAQHAFSDIEEELQHRWDRARRYVPYKHPFAPQISAERIWTQFSPAILGALEAVKAGPEVFSQEALDVLFACYTAQAAFPPHLLHQMLFYREQQSEGVRPDPGLPRAPVSLFGFQTIEDWFGRQFVERVATVILNGACMARAEGYTATAEEARADLISNVALGMKSLSEGKQPDPKEVQKVYALQLRQMGLSEGEVVSLWREVLCFDRMLQEVGDAVFLDRMALDQFREFASPDASVVTYSLPPVLQFNSFRQMLKFQCYKELISDGDLLALPISLRDPQKVMDGHPDLVFKRFDVAIASVEKAEVAARISLRQTWDWEADRENFAALQERFPQLAGAQCETVEDRMAALDALDATLRFRVDQFARDALIGAHPEWIEEQLGCKEMEERTLKVCLKDETTPLSGARFLALLEMEHPSLVCYSPDGEHFFRVDVIKKYAGWEFFSFEEVESIVGKKLDQILQLAYDSDQIEEPFEEVRDRVGARVYTDLVTAIGGDPGGDLESLPALRFSRHLEEMRHLAAEDPDRFAAMQTDPYALVLRSEKRALAPSDALLVGEFAPVSDGQFFQLVEKEPATASADEIARAKGHLAQEARQTLIRNLIEKLP